MILDIKTFVIFFYPPFFKKI